MLHLEYMTISTKELGEIERILVDCTGEPFGVILYNGVLKVNKKLKNPKRLEKIVRTMFEVDHLLEGESAELFDDLYHEVRTAWGDYLWHQIWKAWADTLEAKQKAEDAQAASAWLEQFGNIDYTDSIDDLIPDFHSGILKAIYSKTINIRDIFNYGFQMGAQFGANAVPVNPSV